MSNVAQERVLLGATPVSELLGALGAFGVLVGGAQVGGDGSGVGFGSGPGDRRQGGQW